MSTYVKLVQLYNKYGYQIRTGLYPPQFYDFPGAAGTVIEKNDIKLVTGGGISLGEVYLLDDLCDALSPKGVFIIGNAFGWSTFAFAYAQSSKVLALDAGIEGQDNMAGIELTNMIAQREKLHVQCVYGRSPDDVRTTISENLDNSPSLVFIDGLHTNEQLLSDFNAVFDVAPRAVYLFHDIVNCNMQKAFGQIMATVSGTHYTKILWRTYSGIGVAIPNEVRANVKAIVDAYTDDDDYIATIRIRWKLLNIQRRLGVFGKILDPAYRIMNKPLQVLTNRWSGRGKPR
jgi:hypothetical protein